LVLFIFLAQLFSTFILTYILFINNFNVYEILIKIINIYKNSSITPGRILNSIVIAPVLETFIFYKMLFYYIRKTNLNINLVVHIIGILFFAAHFTIHKSILYIAVYFSGVMWAWAWLIIEKWPPEERVLNPFMSITLMHATLNGLVLGITPLLRWLG